MIKNTREILTAKAKSISGKNDVSVDETRDILKGYVADLFSKYLAYAETETLADSDFVPEVADAMLRDVKSAVALYNDECRVERIEYLCTLKFRDAMVEFMESQTVSGVALAKDKTTKMPCLEWENAPVGIGAFDVINALNPADMNGILDMSEIIADNIARLETKGDNGKVTRKAIHSSKKDLAHRMGWDIETDKLSLTELSKELTAYAGIVFGKEFGVKMINADVKFIMRGILGAKDVANKAGVMTMRNQETLVNFVFRAMYTRIHKLAYDWQDAMDLDKQARTVSGSMPYENEAKPEASAVKVN